jgi:hypothetical protein
MACVLKNFKLCKFFFPGHTKLKLSVCKLMNRKLFFVNVVILIATKILFAYFRKTGSKEGNKKQRGN